MAPSGSLLQVVDVTASRPFEDNRRRRVIHETTLGVAAGEVLAIVGPSGGGKSTLLRLFNRLLEPDGGQILFSGGDVRLIDPPVLRAYVPLVSQKPFLFAGTVKENLQASARLRRAVPPDFSNSDLLEIMKLCQVDSAWLDQDSRKLSVGQQQRVCLARALFGPCRALLLDEPTSALDRPTADRMAQTFRQLAEQKKLAVIIVTHDLRVAEICADRVALLLDGSVVEEGTAEQLLHRPVSAAAQSFLISDPLNARRATK
jgi:putative ABC transport system ATP-binding protein